MSFQPHSAHLHVAPFRVLNVVLILVAHAHVVPRHVVIRAILVRIRKERDCLVIFLLVTRPHIPHFYTHVDASQLEAHVGSRLDGVVLRAHRVQVVQNVLARVGRGPRVPSSLDQHLLEPHEHVRVEVRQPQHGDHRGDGGRGTALLLQALLRDVEGLGREGGELVVDHPARGHQRGGRDAHHVHGVLQ